MKGSTGYALVQLAKRHRGRISAALASLGIHVGQELLLLELWTADGLSQAELSERLGIEQPTVAKTVKRMEAAGLLRRERDVHDARIQRVYLTDRGRELREPVERSWADAEERLLHGLDPQERRTLKELIDKARRTGG